MEIILEILSAVKLAFLGSWFYITPVALFIFFYTAMIDYKQGQFRMGWDPVCLAINIPSNNLRTPFAMEQVFNGLYGIFDERDWIEKNWLGEFQEWISCEIVGIEGKVLFIVWTPKRFQDLVEASIYAQYPEAEVYEVENYTDIIPDNFKKEEFPYEIWGADIDLVNKDCYPLRTYIDYEKMVKTEEAAVDPLASMVEILSSLKEGEQIWLQIICQPISDEWKEEGLREVKNLIGTAPPQKPGFFDKGIGRVVAELADFIFKGVTQAPFRIPEFKTFGATEEEEEKNLLLSRMLYLSPGEQEIVKSIERNISKKGFRSKLRTVVLMHNNIYEKTRFKEFRAKVAGVLSQFGSTTLNSLKFTRKVSAHYWFPEARKSKRKKEVIEEYKGRKITDGRQFNYNTEELATLFHIPLNVVQNPQMTQVVSRKAQAPSVLPIS